MVLLPKQWKSRSSPGFAGGVKQEPIHDFEQSRCRFAERRLCRFGAGWSSPVARQAHNLKVVGSNPTPATNKQAASGRLFCCAETLPAADSATRSRLGEKATDQSQRHETREDDFHLPRPCVGFTRHRPPPATACSTPVRSIESKIGERCATDGPGEGVLRTAVQSDNLAG